MNTTAPDLATVLAQPAGVAAGWALVPVEPTETMLSAAEKVDFCNEDECSMAHNLWNAMLGAVDGYSYERYSCSASTRTSETFPITMLAAAPPAPSLPADRDAKPYLADHFDWAAPGDQQEDAWIVRFCDNDVRDALYTGPDAEREAREAWERHAPGYNMYLFRLARLTPADRDDTAALVEAFAELQLSAFLAGRGSTRSDIQAPSMDDWRRLSANALANRTPPQPASNEVTK